jgi:uncharacterized protein (DUF169 family)
MPFTIDHTLCALCGTCIYNCPNRAIVQQKDTMIITEMCFDCGICLKYCGTGAIKTGPVRTERDSKKLDRALREKLQLKKHIVAMKFADKAPQGIPAEDGLTFWCHICGDVFEGQDTAVYFTAQNSTCGGSAAMGLGVRPVNKEDFNMMMEGVMVGEGCYYASRDVIPKARAQFPQFPGVHDGMIIGPFAQIPMPDIIVFPVNGKQMAMISSAYTFETGEVILVNGGGGTCLATVAIPYLENKPVFTCGDYGGRMHMRLGDEEILACLPFRLVPGIVKNLDRTVYTAQ